MADLWAVRRRIAAELGVTLSDAPRAMLLEHRR
jgi:hypothetical protein